MFATFLHFFCFPLLPYPLRTTDMDPTFDCLFVTSGHNHLHSPLVLLFISSQILHTYMCDFFQACTQHEVSTIAASSSSTVYVPYYIYIYVCVCVCVYSSIFFYWFITCVLDCNDYYHFMYSTIHMTPLYMITHLPAQCTYLL